MDLTLFPPVVRELLSAERLPSLGPGHANEAVRDRLRSLTVESLCAPHPVRQRDFAVACLAGLWLYHDFLDESHRISQELHTTTGSYWHALMHRREPDFDNAKYWLRRVNAHPIYEALRAAAAELAVDAPPGAAFLRTQASWDPFAFVDLCAATLAGRLPCDDSCRQIQKREWELLFDWCYRQAIEER
jgi:hypothetical protein